MNKDYFVGMNLMVDPSVAIVCDGEVLAFSEEERHLRNKHAAGFYPHRALQYCLDVVGIRFEEVSAVAINWDIPAYSDGRMKSFYESLSKKYKVDAATLSWQTRNLGLRKEENYKKSHEQEWRKAFGNINFPKLHYLPHHNSNRYLK